MTTIRRIDPTHLGVTVEIAEEDSGSGFTGRLLVGEPGPLCLLSRESLGDLVAHVVDYASNHSNIDVSPTLISAAVESFIRGDRQQEDEQSGEHRRLHEPTDGTTP